MHPLGKEAMPYQGEVGCACSHVQGAEGDPLRRGDLVEITPSHGCTTINLHDAYYVTRDDVVEAVWPIAARGRIR